MGNLTVVLNSLGVNEQWSCLILSFPKEQCLQKVDEESMGVSNVSWFDECQWDGKNGFVLFTKRQMQVPVAKFGSIFSEVCCHNSLFEYPSFCSASTTAGPFGQGLGFAWCVTGRRY